jgi:hypothetical protein
MTRADPAAPTAFRASAIIRESWLSRAELRAPRRHLRNRVTFADDAPPPFCFPRAAVWRCVAPMHTGCLTRSPRAVGSSVDRHSWFEASLPAPLRSLGRVGMARVDRDARVAKGQRGAAIDVPAQAGLLFTCPPRLGCCNDFKDATKPAARPRQPTYSGSLSHLRGRVSGSKGRFERALAFGCADDCGEAFGSMQMSRKPGCATYQEWLC